MADTDSTTPPTPDAGATKSFWEHLKDLRKALVRSAIAIGVALVLCLLFDDRLMEILKYPLRHMNIFDEAKPTVTIMFGTEIIGPYEVTRDQFPALPKGDAPHVVYQLGISPVSPTINPAPAPASAPTPGVPNPPTATPGPGVAAAAPAAATVAPNPIYSLTLTLDQTKQGDDSTKPHLYNLSPNEGFFIAFHVALYTALILASPFWVYYLGGFILPAFHMHERRVIFSWIGWSILLFLLGVLSTYFLLLPVALRAAVIYSHWMHFESTIWRAADYINFACIFILGMGLGFQFPLVVLFFVKIGLLTHKQLAHFRRHVVIISFILGALLTTPEIITQVAMAIPLCILYELCIWIAWYWERKKRRADAALDI